jgi:hypothetical protein
MLQIPAAKETAMKTFMLIALMFFTTTVFASNDQIRICAVSGGRFESLNAEVSGNQLHLNQVLGGEASKDIKKITAAVTLSAAELNQIASKIKFHAYSLISGTKYVLENSESYVIATDRAGVKHLINIFDAAVFKQYSLTGSSSSCL